MANNNIRIKIEAERDLMVSLKDWYSSTRFFKENRNHVNYTTGYFDKPLILSLAHERDATAMKHASNVVKATAGYVEGSAFWKSQIVDAREQALVERDQQGSSCRAQAVLLGHVPNLTSRKFEFEIVPKGLHVNRHCLLCGSRGHGAVGVAACDWFQAAYTQEYGRRYLTTFSLAETTQKVQGYAYQAPAALQALLGPQDNASASQATIAAAAVSQHPVN